MSYIGNTPTSQSFISGTDYFNGNGSTTAFTLTRTVGSVNDIEAVVENVVQRPNDAYTISGTTITFTSAPPSGTNNIYVRYLSTTTQSITPVQNSVSYATMNTDLQNQWGTGFKNRIINGDMRIDQRNAGASITLPDSTTTYTLDRWVAFENGSMVFSIQRSSTAPTSFTNSILITTTTGAAAGASERSQILQRIEGFNVADLNWGTANAKTVTLSFWIRSSLTGQFGGSLQNVNADRSYPFSFTISAANTFEYKTITITGDTTGTWATDNSTGIQLNFDLGMGSSLLGTAGAWAAADYRGATGDTKLSGTTGATMYITGVQIEVGSTATPFEVRPYGAELQLCYRYYYLHASFAETNYGVIGIGYNYSSSQMNSIVYFPVTMRIAPALISTSGTDYYMFERNSGDDYLNSLTLSGSSTPKVGSLVNNTNISGTAGQAGRLLVFTSGASVAFNAEL